jgi:hypothetical protein
MLNIPNNSSTQSLCGFWILESRRGKEDTPRPDCFPAFRNPLPSLLLGKWNDRKLHIVQETQLSVVPTKSKPHYFLTLTNFDNSITLTYKISSRQFKTTEGGRCISGRACHHVPFNINLHLVGGCGVVCITFCPISRFSTTSSTRFCR